MSVANSGRPTPLLFLIKPAFRAPLTNAVRPVWWTAVHRLHAAAGRLRLVSSRELSRQVVFLLEFALWTILLSLLTGLALLCRFNLSTAGLLYLFAVVLAAIWSSFWQATIASVLAAVCQCFFFAPPAFSFYIADPRNLVSIATFEMCALVVSRLAAKERDSTRQFLKQRASKEQLYEFTRAALSLDMLSDPSPQIVALLRDTFHLRSATLTGAEGSTTCSAGQIEDADDSDGVLVRDLRVNAVELGTLRIHGDLSPLTMDALQTLVSTTLERHRAFTSECSAQAARQAELLRTAVLDSLAHSFKTPLTTMRVASSGLLEIARLSPLDAELVASFDEQLTLLNSLTTRLLRAARMDHAASGVRRRRIVLADLIRKTLDQPSANWAGRTIDLRIEDVSLNTEGDRELLAMVIAQFMDNAAKYSFAGTAIRVTCRAIGSEILLSVHNQGPAVPLEDRERIFERFYRSPGTEHVVPGTGIGLAVVRKAAEAHGGHAWVISDPVEGTEFFLSLQR